MYANMISIMAVFVAIFSIVFAGGNFLFQSVNPADNGWRALGDTDTEEYINIPDNNLVVDFDRLVEIEPAVLAIYDMPVGTDLEFDQQRKVFIDSHTGKEYH